MIGTLEVLVVHDRDRHEDREVPHHEDLDHEADLDQDEKIQEADRDHALQIRNRDDQEADRDLTHDESSISEECRKYCHFS